MTATDYISLAETKLRLGDATVERPCVREKALRDALQLLPDSSPGNIHGFARAMNACARLTALERAVRAAEAELKAAMSEVRKSVAKEWKASEIGDETKAILEVW